MGCMAKKQRRSTTKKKRGAPRRKSARRAGARGKGGGRTNLRAYCRALPHTTEDIKWGDDLVFSIGAKMYAGFGADGSAEPFAFKCEEEEFWRLIQKKGIVPAPYAARFFWVMVERRDALSDAEYKRLLRKAYDVVLAKLPARTRARLSSP